MKTAGVIAEFDPFHNGHGYFLRRVRKLTSADFIIVVMSGDFTQRGRAALLDKRIRTKAALMNGADVVIELPVQYATASAELFAYAGVSLLDALSCVEVLCFGTEAEEIEELEKAAAILSSETDAYRAALDEALKKGSNYPEARMKALAELVPEGADTLEDTLSRPNNILAVEYLKALGSLGSSMKSLNIKREAADHDSGKTCGVYSSAKNIRETLKDTGTLESVSAYLPEDTLPLLREHFMKDFPVGDDDLSLLMKYRLGMESEDSLMRYVDMSGDLARRIIKHRNDFADTEQFTALIKTRNITYTRVSRALIHALLGITKEDMESYAVAGTVGYARVLGFRKEASPLMDHMNKNAKIPVISRLSEYKRLAAPPFDRMLEDTLRASDIYHSVIKEKYDTDIPSDISHMALSEDGMVLI